MSPGANAKCPRDCGGRLEESGEPGTYRCQRCGNKLHQVVVDDIDGFRRIAESDGPAAPLAQAALGLDVESAASEQIVDDVTEVLFGGGDR